MLCDICKKSEATVHLTQIVESKLLKVDLCEACAKVCDDCAAACEKHPNDEHMAKCAKECRTCAKACREMIEHMKHS